MQREQQQLLQQQPGSCGLDQGLSVFEGKLTQMPFAALRYNLGSKSEVEFHC